MRFVELEHCKATFLFLNQANLIWKPHGLVNAGFHNIACTELLFRMELCFNCWESFHHGNLASAIRLLAIQPKIYKCRQLVLLREYQGADKFAFVKNGFISSLPSCLASSLCMTTTKNYLTIQTSFMHHCSLKKTCNCKTMLDMEVKLTHILCFGRWVHIVSHTCNVKLQLFRHKRCLASEGQVSYFCREETENKFSTCLPATVPPWKTTPISHSRQDFNSWNLHINSVCFPSKKCGLMRQKCARAHHNWECTWNHMHQHSYFKHLSFLCSIN